MLYGLFYHKNCDLNIISIASLLFILAGFVEIFIGISIVT